MIGCISGTARPTSMEQALNKSPWFKISVAFLLFRYMVQAPGRGSPNIHDFIIEMYGKGAQKGRRWQSGCDVAYQSSANFTFLAYFSLNEIGYSFLLLQQFIHCHVQVTVTFMIVNKYDSNKACNKEYTSYLIAYTCLSFMTPHCILNLSK